MDMCLEKEFYAKDIPNICNDLLVQKSLSCLTARIPLQQMKKFLGGKIRPEPNKSEILIMQRVFQLSPLTKGTYIKEKVTFFLQKDGNK